MIDLAKITIALLGIFGFGLAAFIRQKKAGGARMVCYIGQDCNTVVHSEYSRFLGVPIEFLGMAYYAVIALSYSAFLASPNFAVMPVISALLAFTTAAFLFSLYLTFIQGFVLREWCEWCLTSAALSAVIFILAFRSIPYGVFELLGANRTPILILHGLAMAIGLGGATLTDVLFFKFLKDLRISVEEADILKSASQVIWLALAVLLLTGLALWLPNAEYLGGSPKFLVKMIAIGVIIGNGLLLNLWIQPRLIGISFGERHEGAPNGLSKARRFAFALGAISITSWYSAFILGSLRAIPFGFWQLLGLYIALLAAAVFISQRANRSFAAEV